MDETFYIKGFIIKKEPWREVDSKIIVYSLEEGKLELIARGTQKILSKLSSHIEPINLVELMIIKGKQFDYVGAARSEENFKNIKNDFNKMVIAGEVLKSFDQLIKGREKDEKIFSFLGESFYFLNNQSFSQSLVDLMPAVFKLKLVSFLGYRPVFNESKIKDDRVTLILGNLLGKKWSYLQEVEVSLEEIKKIRDYVNTKFLEILDQ